MVWDGGEFCSLTNRSYLGDSEFFWMPWGRPLSRNSFHKNVFFNLFRLIINNRQLFGAMILQRSEVLGNISKVEAKRDSPKLSSISVLTSTFKKQSHCQSSSRRLAWAPTPTGGRIISPIFKIIVLILTSSDSKDSGLIWGPLGHRISLGTVIMKIWISVHSFSRDKASCKDVCRAITLVLVPFASAT